jgi:hypothetical protein
MPPIAIPAAVKLVLGAIGAAAVVHWVVKEVRRINESSIGSRLRPWSSPLLAKRCRRCGAIHRAASGD